MIHSKRLFWIVILIFFIRDNFIKNDGMIYLKSALKENKTIKKITLNRLFLINLDNPIEDEGIFYLIEALNFNTTVAKIIMMCNC